MFSGGTEKQHRAVMGLVLYYMKFLHPAFQQMA